MNVLVIGTGAVGSYYGSMLARGGVDVSVLARSDYETVRRDGIEISSPKGDFHFRPRQVVRDASELAESPDHVLLCIKVVDGADRIGLLRQSLGVDSTIVLISNGIDIEQEVADAFPSHELISGLAFICVTRTAPGKICHQAYGRLALGNYPAGLSERARALAAAFELSGCPCQATETILTARWQKCVWNASFSPLSVLSGGMETAAILDSQEPLVRRIMEEINAIAAAAGHPLPENIVDLNIDSTRKMPPYKPSMLLDFEDGRPMEIECILGNAVRWGRRLSVNIPHLETLYGLMKMRESQTHRFPIR